MQRDCVHAKAVFVPELSTSTGAFRITDMRFIDIDGAPKRCTLIKIETNQGICGHGSVALLGSQ